jgi:transcriptional regulator with XRE-family HTH domain
MKGWCFMKLKEIRKQRSIPAQDLATAINKSIASYYKKENGQIKLSIEEMSILSKFFGISEQDLFFA